MKPVPFFSDAIVILPHSATNESHIGKPISIAEFAQGCPVSLYEAPNGDLRLVMFGLSTCNPPFIEGPEHTRIPAGAEVVVAKPTGVPVSIQVATTVIGADDAMVVPQASDDATHWSVYLRTSDGTVEHVKDFEIKSFNPGNVGAAKSSALIRAAALSMEHQVPIERIV